MTSTPAAGTAAAAGRSMGEVGWLERGRRPAIVSLGAAIGLAAFTGVRFVMLVSMVSPSDYGRFNLLNLMINLLPMVMSAGLTLQYQRLVHANGHPAVRPLFRSALIVTLAGTIPTLVLALVLVEPVRAQDRAILLALAVTATAATCSLSTFASQVQLGLGNRATSSLIMFASNSVPTLAVGVAWVAGQGVVGILFWWASASLAVCSVASQLVRRSGPAPRDPASVTVRISLLEGVLSIPAQAGIWSYTFALRYVLGLNLGTEAVALYAVAATVFDTAFLVAASLLNYFTNRVMTGAQSPWRGLSMAVPIYAALSLVGAATANWLLPIVGNDGFEFDATLGLMLATGGLARLYISAWRPRAVGLTRTHIVSVAYLVVTGAAVVIFVTLPDLSIYWYGAATVVGFSLVAGIQRIALKEGARR